MTTAFFKALAAVLFFSLIIGLIALLPSAADHPVPSGITEAFTWMYASIAPIEYISPARVAIDLMLLSIAFELGYWIWYGIRMIIGWVQGFLN